MLSRSADTVVHRPLRKVLTTRLMYFFILGDVLGAGVYVLIGEVAATSGGAVWVRAGSPHRCALLALLTAASYAELATKYPRAGGPSRYVTRAYVLRRRRRVTVADAACLPDSH